MQRHRLAGDAHAAGSDWFENQEDEKNSQEFFEVESRRAFGSSLASGLKTLSTPKNVKPPEDLQKIFLND